MTAPNQPNDKKNIVIVEDDTDLLRMLTFAFKAEGYPIKGFTTGQEAMDFMMVKENLDSVCLVILDRLLPDMDGIEILKAYTEKFNKHIPVMILSVLSAERDVLTGLREGAVEYITKPFNLPILLEKAMVLISRFS